MAKYLYQYGLHLHNNKYGSKKVPQVPNIAVQNHQQVQQQSTAYNQPRATLANAQTEECQRKAQSLNYRDHQHQSIEETTWNQ